MTANLLLPPSSAFLGEWIDHTANLVVRYDEAILTGLVTKSSRYVFLTPKTILWKGTFTMPAGVASTYVIGLDLPLPGKIISGHDALGSAEALRPGTWFAQATLTRLGSLANGQRAFFAPEYNAGEVWGKSSGGITGPNSWVPGDVYWWEGKYELA